MRGRILILSTLLACSTIVASRSLDTAKIDEALGRSGQKTGDLYRLGFPRTDLHVSDLLAVVGSLVCEGTTRSLPKRFRRVTWWMVLFVDND